MSMPNGLTWTRLGDALPDIGEPILLARWDPEMGGWRVRDAALRIRFEEVVPKPSDMNGRSAPHWWFDCIYPGKGDMRLGDPDLLWTRMPTPPEPEEPK